MTKNWYQGLTARISGDTDLSSQGSVRLNLHDLPLVGRSFELSVLEKAYKRVQNGACSEIVMLSGRSGTGKSFLVQKMMKKQEQENPADFRYETHTAYHCSGKFNQIKSAEPFQALKQPFSELCDYVLSSSSREEICKDLKDALGSEIKTLIDVIPAVGALVGGNQNEAGDTQSNVESFYRLKYLFQVFAHTICKYRRLVLFLDDLQWADRSTMDLIESIISDLDLKNFVFIGTYRDDEVDNHHCLSHMLSGLKKLRKVREITVEDLSVKAIDELLRQLTNCANEESMPVAEVLHRKTMGNALLLRQLLQILESTNLIEYLPLASKWTLRLDEIEEHSFLADSIVEIVTARVKRMPPITNAILKLAACLWSRFQVDLLFQIIQGLHSEEYREIRSEADLVQALDSAVADILIDKLKKGEYKFSHDIIQQASYNLLSEGEERDKFHLMIGEEIWSLLRSSSPKNWMLFSAADQLNQGSDCIETGTKRLDLSRLNLKAGKSAIKTSAFMPALKYLQCGIDLLEDDAWQKHYTHTLELHTLMADVAMCLGQNDICFRSATEVFNYSDSMIEKLSLYRSIIWAFGSERRYEEAGGVTREVLRKVGVRIPTKANMGHVLISLIRTMNMLKGVSDDELLSLKPLESVEIAYAMRLLKKEALHSILQSRPNDFLVASLRGIQLSLQHGIDKSSPSCIVYYGAALASLGNITEGNRYGEIALKMLDQLGAKKWEADTRCAYYIFLCHWKKPYSECMDGLVQAYKDGMMYGDVEGAFHSGICAVSYFFMAGLDLEACESDAKLYCEQMRAYNRENNYTVSCMTWQLLLNLLGRSADPLILTGEATEEVEFVAKMTEDRNVGALQSYWINKAQSAYYFGDMRTAKHVLKEFGKTKASLTSHFWIVIYTYFSGLVLAELAMKTKKRKYRQRLLRIIRTLEGWVKLGNGNVAHKLLLLKAELSIIDGSTEHQVREAYNTAIATASRAGFRQDAALGNERVGGWLHAMGDAFWGNSYLRNAHQLYTEWKAFAKADDLARHYPTIFRLECESLLQSTEQSDHSVPIPLYRSETSSATMSSHGIPSNSRNVRGVKQFDPDAGGQHQQVTHTGSSSMREDVPTSFMLASAGGLLQRNFT